MSTGFKCIRKADKDFEVKRTSKQKSVNQIYWLGIFSFVGFFGVFLEYLEEPIGLLH